LHLPIEAIRKVSKASTLNLLMCISFIHGMAWHGI
jgi:hypothetical protein